MTPSRQRNGPLLTFSDRTAVIGSGDVPDRRAVGHLLVATSAPRAEVASHHHPPPGRVVDADPAGVGAGTATLDEHAR